MSKTDDIHRAILAKAAQPAAPRTAIAPGARPYVAEAGQRLAQGLQEENQRLKTERASGEVILALDPKDIAHSKYVNRHVLSLQMADEEFASLYNSLKTDKQDQEILVRPSPPEATHGKPYEVGFGHRRHGVALLLDRELPDGFKILARIKPMTDRELIDVMDRENAQHKPLSAFELAWQYKTSLDEGLYDSQIALGQAKGLTRASISRYLQLATLPQEILDAFRDPRAIRILWVQDIVRVLGERGPYVLDVARRLKDDSSLSAEQVFQSLLRAPQSETTNSPEEKVFRAPGGQRVVCRTVVRRGSVKLRWGPGIDPKYQDEFSEALNKFVAQRLKESAPMLIPKAKRKGRKKS